MNDGKMRLVRRRRINGDDIAVRTLLTAALLAASVCTASAEPAGIEGSPTPHPSRVVLRFVPAPGTDSATLPEQACSQSNKAGRTGNDANAQAGVNVDPRLVAAIVNEIQKKLSNRMTVTVDDDPKAIPVGALVISGCITRADPGNATGRLIGMGLGTSHLAAHVKVLSKSEAGFVPVDEFDVQAKGGKVLPALGPVGLVAHAAAEHRETLSADASKLADQILKKLAKTLKSQ
jgi:hypothetical protein